MLRKMERARIIRTGLVPAPDLVRIGGDAFQSEPVKERRDLCGGRRLGQFLVSDSTDDLVTHRPVSESDSRAENRKK